MEPTSDGEVTVAAKEFEANKWLYMALMCVLTVGYIHLMCFAALVISVSIYYMSKCLHTAE